MATTNPTLVPTPGLIKIDAGLDLIVTGMLALLAKSQAPHNDDSDLTSIVVTLQRGIADIEAGENLVNLEGRAS